MQVKKKVSFQLCWSKTKACSKASPAVNGEASLRTGDTRKVEALKGPVALAFPWWIYCKEFGLLTFLGTLGARKTYPQQRRVRCGNSSTDCTDWSARNLLVCPQGSWLVSLQGCSQLTLKVPAVRECIWGLEESQWSSWLEEGHEVRARQGTTGQSDAPWCLQRWCNQSSWKPLHKVKGQEGDGEWSARIYGGESRHGQPHGLLW